MSLKDKIYEIAENIPVEVGQFAYCAVVTVVLGGATIMFSNYMDKLTAQAIQERQANQVQMKNTAGSECIDVFIEREGKKYYSEIDGKSVTNYLK